MPSTISPDQIPARRRGPRDPLAESQEFARLLAQKSNEGKFIVGDEVYDENKDAQKHVQRVKREAASIMELDAGALRSRTWPDGDGGFAYGLAVKNGDGE